MKISDYKNDNIARSLKKYKKLDKDLLNCASLSKQKECLVKYYNCSVVTRDELIARKSSLERRQSFGFAEIIKCYKDLFIAVSVGVLTGIIGDLILTDKNAVAFIHNTFSLMCLSFLAICIVIFLDKRSYYRTEVPVHEISLLEIKMISSALSSDKEEFDIAEYFKNYNKSSLRRSRYKGCRRKRRKQ